MQFSFFSLALLAASVIPSAFADVTIYKTKILTKTQTVKLTNWSWRRTTIVKYRPTTVTKHTTVTKITVRTTFLKPSPVTITKTIKECPTPTEEEPEAEGEGEGEGEGEDEEEAFKSCPPVTVITPTPSCKVAPACPEESLCEQPTPTVTYRCNCGAAPRRTATARARCPNECCGGYVPTFYTFVPLPVERCVQPFGVSETLI